MTRPPVGSARSLARLAVAASLALASVGCDVPGAERWPDDATVLARFEELHRHVYGAYRIGADPEALHRWLEGSFTGEALTEEYIAHFVAARSMEREQTAIDIVRVDYEKLGVERERRRLWIDADWSVGGTVTHQGHRHPRINRYRARYALVPVEAGEGVELRIGETLLLSQERRRTVRSTGFQLDGLPQSARGSMSLGELLRSGVVPPDDPGQESSAKRADQP